MGTSPQPSRAPDHRTQRERERGDVAAELALIAPLYLLLILGMIQLALWLHAVNVVTAAAQEGVRAARGLDGTAQTGRRTAETYLVQLGGFLTNPRVHASRTVDTARVEITARTQATVFGLTLPVRAVAQSPVEMVTAHPRPRPSPDRDRRSGADGTVSHAVGFPDDLQVAACAPAPGSQVRLRPTGATDRALEHRGGEHR